MKILKSLLLMHLAVFVAAAQQPPAQVPREWIDPDTGHRVVRLSEEAGSQSLYFHQNAYTPDGTKMIMTTPTGLAAVNLKTHAVEKVVEGRVSILIVGKKTGQVYYTKFVREANKFSATVYATDLDTKATREVVKLQPGVSVSSSTPTRRCSPARSTSSSRRTSPKGAARGSTARRPPPPRRTARAPPPRPQARRRRGVRAATSTPARGR